MSACEVTVGPMVLMVECSAGSREVGVRFSVGPFYLSNVETMLAISDETNPNAQSHQENLS